MRHLKTYKIFESEIDIDDYIHGSCELFTLAMHEELGYDMYFLFDSQAYFEDTDSYDTALVHAYCKDSDGNMYDASGVIDEEYLENEFENNDPYTEKISDKEFRKLSNSGFIQKIKRTEVELLRKYIKDNIEKYKK